MNALSLPSIPDARLPRAYEAAQTVYFVQNGMTGAVKIGFTTDLQRRLVSLSVGCDAKLHVIRTVDGGARCERWLHKRFAGQHLRGEWFAFHPEMMTVHPPTEIHRAKPEIVRRDVCLSMRERVTAAVALADGLTLSPKEKLLTVISTLSEEEAKMAIEILLRASVAVAS